MNQKKIHQVYRRTGDEEMLPHGVNSAADEFGDSIYPVYLIGIGVEYNGNPGEVNDDQKQVPGLLNNEMTLC